MNSMQAGRYAGWVRRLRRPKTSWLANPLSRPESISGPTTVEPCACLLSTPLHRNSPHRPGGSRLPAQLGRGGAGQPSGWQWGSSFVSVISIGDFRLFVCEVPGDFGFVFAAEHALEHQIQRALGDLGVDLIDAGHGLGWLEHALADGWRAGDHGSGSLVGGLPENVGAEVVAAYLPARGLFDTQAVLSRNSLTGKPVRDGAAALPAEPDAFSKFGLTADSLNGVS